MTGFVVQGHIWFIVKEQKTQVNWSNISLLVYYWNYWLYLWVHQGFNRMDPFLKPYSVRRSFWQDNYCIFITNF